MQRKFDLMQFNVIQLSGTHLNFSVNIVKLIKINLIDFLNLIDLIFNLT